jgi:hypothetical protein
VLRLMLLLFGAELKAEVSARIESATRAAMWMTFAAVFALLGLAFLLIALAVWLAPMIGAAAAAAVVGVGALVIAGAAVVAARSGGRPRRRSEGPSPLVAAAAAVPPGMTGRLAVAALAALVVGMIVGRRL